MATTKIPILMYHEVANEDRVKLLSQKIGSSWISTKKDFEEQMAYLRDSGYETISLDRLTGYINGIDSQNKFPLKPVVITFDDGFAGNYEYAFPILQGYGMTATFFVTVNDISRKYMLTWDQLLEMNRFNMSIQTHTLTHPLLSELGFNETEKEIVESRKKIEDKIGVKVNYISLPNGDYNKHYFNIMKENDFRGGCSSIFGFNSVGTNRFLLRRIDIRNNCEVSMFKELVDSNSLLSKKIFYKSLVKRGIAKVVSKKIYHRIYKTYNGIFH